METAGRDLDCTNLVDSSKSYMSPSCESDPPITAADLPSKGPFIYVLGTRARQNVLETSSRYTSVQIASTVKCSRYPFVQI